MTTHSVNPWPRRVMWGLWGIIPVGVLAFHLSAGEPLVARDRGGALIAEARALMEQEEFAGAAEKFAAARAALPDDAAGEKSRLQLAEARARVKGGELVEGQAMLESLLGEQETLAQSGKADEALVRSVRHDLASASYYLAWAMRLEGATEDEWLPETEKARQQYRLLAESSGDAADKELFSKNLEAVIRLEQMDLDELRAQPLPKNCKNCKNCCQKKRGQKLSKCSSKNPSDARDEIKKSGASDAMKRGKGS